MTNRTAFLLFVLGFILWYANRKKTVVSTTNNTPNSQTNLSQFLVTSGGGGTTTPVAPRMVNGVPVWLQAIGVSHSGSTNDTSLFIQADLLPDVKIDIVGGGTAFGVGWSIGTAVRAIAYVLRNFNSVLRLNPTVSGLGGILNDKGYYATLTNPNAPNETITVQFRTPPGDSVGIENVPLVPVVIGANPIIDVPIMPIMPVVPGTQTPGAFNVVYADYNPGGFPQGMGTITPQWETDSNGRNWVRLLHSGGPVASGEYHRYWLIDEDGTPTPGVAWNPFEGNLVDFGKFPENFVATVQLIIAKGTQFVNFQGENNAYKIYNAGAQIFTGTKPQ